MLTKDELNHYSEVLETRKRELLEEIEKKSESVDFGNDVDGFDEEGDEAQSLQNQLSVGHELKLRVNEIDGAIGKLRTGNYGVCEQCEEVITKEVLDIVPESDLCAPCKRAKSE